MLPVQGQEEVRVDVAQTLDRDELAVDGALALEEAEVAVLDEGGHAAFGGFGIEDGERLVLLEGDDGGRLGGRAGIDGAVEDARLRPGDLCQRVAEKRLMVHADAREHADLGIGDVGRVPLPSHADLGDDDVDGGVGEDREREDREHLEVGEGRPARLGEFGVDDVEVRGDLVEDPHEVLIGDRVAVDGDPLGHRMQVGAGEASHPQVVGGEDRIDHPRRRRLAVRPGHRDDRRARWMSPRSSTARFVASRRTSTWAPLPG